MSTINESVRTKGEEGSAAVIQRVKDKEASTWEKRKGCFETGGLRPAIAAQDASELGKRGGLHSKGGNGVRGKVLGLGKTTQSEETKDAL